MTYGCNSQMRCHVHTQLISHHATTALPCSKFTNCINQRCESYEGPTSDGSIKMCRPLSVLRPRSCLRPRCPARARPPRVGPRLLPKRRPPLCRRRSSCSSSSRCRCIDEKTLVRAVADDQLLIDLGAGLRAPLRIANEGEPTDMILPIPHHIVVVFRI